MSEQGFSEVSTIDLSDHDEKDLRNVSTQRQCTKRERCMGWGIVGTAIMTFIFIVITVYQRKQLLQMEDSGPCLTPACVTLASALIQSMDTTADPCQDFFQYSCGGWIKSNDIPESKSRWTTFSVLTETNRKLLRGLLESSPSSDSNFRTAQTFYGNCMNLSAIEEQGATPLQPLLQRATTYISDVAHQNSSLGQARVLARALAEYNIQGFSMFFYSGVGIDDKNSSRNVMFVGQGGLGLPQDYYPNVSTEGSAPEEQLTAYRTYLETLLALIGTADPADVASKVFTLENEMAKAFVPQADLRDPQSLYNNMSVDDLQTLCPAVDWITYYNTLYPDRAQELSSRLIVNTPSYLRVLPRILQTPVTTVAAYFQTRVLLELAPHLSSPFRSASLAFNKALYGVSSESPRWELCVSRTDSALGFILGKMFIDLAFPGDSKSVAERMVNDVRHAFESNLPHVDWLDASTRTKAADKAEAVAFKIGYPDWIGDQAKLHTYYENISVVTGQYAESMLNVFAFQSVTNLAKLWKPVDKGEWDMSPSTVNAYYSPSNNEMVFPAGILQPPFFHKDFPDAYIFGAMGAVMGHELSHGFDDQGSQYDKHGELSNWWSDEIRQKFVNRSQCIADQYGNYTVPSGDHLNGKLTLGENIADNGGLKAAFLAANARLKKDNRIKSDLPGLKLTPDQLFFVAYSQSWCGMSRAEALKYSISTDPHSPVQFRIIGPVSNSKEFASAFKCPAGSQMNPTSKCQLW